MQNELKRKYGLPTAISMVVGIIIGSGIFFKAQKVLEVSEGSLPISVLAWVIGGLIMIVCSVAFANLASRYERVNGIVDYAEVAVSPKYGYLVGWFMTIIYYPAITSVLAWVSARYFCELFGMDITGGGCLAIAAFFMCASYGINAISPKLAGKFQVGTTVIKLVPLIAVGIIGTVIGLTNGLTAANFSAPVVSATFAPGSALFISVCATAFAYEGWIIATSINSELIDGKKNLPKALVSGALIVITVYILYNVGLFGAVERDVVLNQGTTPAFSALFGSAGATIVAALIVVSCLGTLNGLMLGCTRGLYSIAVRGVGPKPEVFRQVDPATNMPSNSSIIGVVLCGFWLMYFYGANLTSPLWFGPFSFDSSELPIITLYAAYIPIFIMTMKKERDMKPFARIGINTLAIIGCLFMMVAAVVSHKMAVVYYLGIFAAVMLVGLMFYKKGKAE